jgi:hypothetical protein
VEEWPDDGTNARCFGLLRDMKLTGVLGGRCPVISTIHQERTMTETNKVSMPSNARVLASKKAPFRRDVSAPWLLRQVEAKMKLGHRGRVEVEEDK